MAFLPTTPMVLNANSAGAVTASINITTVSNFAFQISAATGTHTQHEICLQLSLDNTNWTDYVKIVGVNGIIDKGAVAPGYARFKVGKAEGATSTVNINFNGK